MPAALTPNEDRLARLCLRNAPQALHQDILDELAGRLLAAKRKSKPIDNPIGYLAQLCKAAGKGAFTLTSLGLKAREQRDRDNHLKQLEETSRERALAHMQSLLGNRSQTHPERASLTLGRGDGSAITPPHDILPDGSAINPATGPPSGSHERFKPGG